MSADNPVEEGIRPSAPPLGVVARLCRRRREKPVGAEERALLRLLGALPAPVKMATAAEIRRMREEGEA